MKKHDKLRLKEIKKIIKKPPEEVVKQLEKWRYCPLCDFTTTLKECPKDGTKTKKITKKDKYHSLKSLLKILIEKELITKDEVVKFELTKMFWKYK